MSYPISRYRRGLRQTQARDTGLALDVHLSRFPHRIPERIVKCDGIL